MNIKKITIAILGVTLLAGCASLEERLASNDPTTKREAEVELISQSRRSPNQGDRIAAINRVTDQELLLFVATSAQGAYVPDGLAALVKLNGENAFVAVVNSAQDAQIRKAAFDKINNQEFFEKLSVGASDPSIRAAAFDKLTSQESILKVAGQSTDRTVRISAIDKVTDKSKLLPILFKKVAAKPSASKKEEIQKAMKTIMRDRRKSDDEKKQMITQLSAMAKGVDPSIDNVVVDAFVAKCKDKAVLLKMIADYGEILTSDQCSSLATNNSDNELKNAIATIADKKIYAEVSAYDDPDVLDKYFEKISSLSSGVLKAKLIAEWGNRYNIGMQGISVNLDKLLKGLNGEGVVTLVNLLKDKAYYVTDRFSENATCEAIKYADRFENLWWLADLAERVGKSSEVKELFHQKPDWGFVRMYKAITDSDTAEYVLLHMTGKKLEEREERKEAVCYLFDQLNDSAINNVLRKIPEWEFFEVYNKVANPELADYLFDKLTFSSLKEFEVKRGETIQIGCYDKFGGTIGVGLQASEILCNIVKQLSAAKKHKLLEIAERNIARAKTHTIVFEKFYIGMPLVDYIVQSDYLKMKWLNIKDCRVGNPISLAKRVRNDSDLKNSITVESFEFDQKERYKIFKTEGDVKGILAFVQKYCKKDADVRDIQYDTDLWWRFTDDAHELKVFVHCKNGALKIESL